MRIAKPMLGAAVILAVSFVVCLVVPAQADTLEWALTQAYQNNPQLNSQRAITRQADEGVPQALSGYRPKVAATATAGSQFQQTTSKSPGLGAVPPVYVTTEA